MLNLPFSTKFFEGLTIEQGSIIHQHRVWLLLVLLVLLATPPFVDSDIALPALVPHLHDGGVHAGPPEPPLAPFLKPLVPYHAEWRVDSISGRRAFGINIWLLSIGTFSTW